MVWDHIKHTISTERIILVNATADILHSVISGNEALIKCLDITIPNRWTVFGEQPFLYALERIENNEDALWWGWLPILKSENSLIGNCGYKGPPQNGVVEIGYEIALDYRGHGYATEIAGALIKNAFSLTAVREIIAHTLAEENASVKILKTCGFAFTEEINDPEDGQIWKWKLPRSADGAKTE